MSANKKNIIKSVANLAWNDLYINSHTILMFPAFCMAFFRGTVCHPTLQQGKMSTRRKVHYLHIQDYEGNFFHERRGKKCQNLEKTLI